MAQSLRLVMCFHLTAGIHRPRLQSSPSPPSSAQWILPSRLDLLRLARWSFCPSLLVVAVALRRLVGWTAACNPNVAPDVVLCRSAMSMMPLLAVAASGRWPPCHNRGCADMSPPWSSASLLCELTYEFDFFSLVSVFMLWWPGQRARHACLCCCAMLELVLLLS
jgi:hypothetical protein